MTADATLRLRVDRSQFSTGLQAAHTDLGKLGDRFSSLAANALGALGIGLSVSGGIAMVKNFYKTAEEATAAWDDLQASLRQSDAQWAKTRDGAENLAQTLGEKFTVDDEDIAKIQAKLVNAGYTYEQSVRQVGLVMDVAARYHIGLEEAAGAVGRIFMGNTKVMKQFGLEASKTGDSTKDAQANMAKLAESTAGAHDRMIARNPGKAAALMVDQVHEALSRGFIAEFSKALIGVDQAASGASQSIQDLARSQGEYWGSKAGTATGAAGEFFASTAATAQSVLSAGQVVGGAIAGTVGKYVAMATGSESAARLANWGEDTIARAQRESALANEAYMRAYGPEASAGGLYTQRMSDAQRAKQGNGPDTTSVSPGLQAADEAARRKREAALAKQMAAFGIQTAPTINIRIADATGNGVAASIEDTE